jgi:hypothetical protein
MPYDRDYRYLKYDERNLNPVVYTNVLGFVIPHSVLQWPTPDGSFVVRLIGSISEKLTSCHPGDVGLYQRLVPELSRLSKRLPHDVVGPDVYDFLQDVTELAVALADKWGRLDKVRAMKPVKRPRKRPSKAIESTRRVINQEHQEHIKEHA